MSRILAIDPGPKGSAWVVLDGERVEGAHEPNDAVLGRLRRGLFPWGSVPTVETACVIEMLAGSYGQAVGIETMETAVTVGRFAEAWETASGRSAALMFRKTAVAYLCGTVRANDSHVRQALVDHFGGDSVALARPQRCEACAGRGTEKAFAPCEDCAGRGKVMSAAWGLKNCPACKGRGRVPITPPCLKCGGTGRAGADGPLTGISGHLWAALAIGVAAQGLVLPARREPGAGG